MSERSILAHPLVGQTDSILFELDALMRQAPASSEAAAILSLRLMLHAPVGHRLALARCWGLPRVIRYRTEIAVPGGRADLLLSHADGSLSLVEVKGGAVDRRALLGGIGQLCYYAAALGAPEKPIRRILAAPLTVEDGLAVGPACSMAGVELRGLPGWQEFGMCLEDYRRQAVEHP